MEKVRVWLYLVLITGCRWHFNEVPGDPGGPDAGVCVEGSTCSPAGSCFTGLASCDVGCVIDQPLDQVPCSGGTCATGVCIGPATTPFIAPAGGGSNSYFGT